MTPQGAIAEELQRPGAITKSYGFIGKWFGRVAGTASALNLIHGAFQIGFGPTLQRLIEAYEQMVSRLFGPLETFFTSLLNALGQWMGFEISLESYWKHILIIMLVYFGARLRSMWTTGEQRVSYGMRWTMVIIAVLAAVLGSVSAGAAPGQIGEQPFLLALAVALLPLFASWLFDLTENVLTAVTRPDVEKTSQAPSAMSVFSTLFRKSASRFFGALLVLVLWVLASTFTLEGVANPGLAGLMILVLLAIPYWLDQGRRTVPRRRLPNEPWWAAFWRLGSTRVAVELMVILAFMATTIVVAAGWDVMA